MFAFFFNLFSFFSVSYVGLNSVLQLFAGKQFDSFNYVFISYIMFFSQVFALLALYGFAIPSAFASALYFLLSVIEILTINKNKNNHCIVFKPLLFLFFPFNSAILFYLLCFILEIFLYNKNTNHNFNQKYVAEIIYYCANILNFGYYYRNKLVSFLYERNFLVLVFL